MQSRFLLLILLITAGAASAQIRALPNLRQKLEDSLRLNHNRITDTTIRNYRDLMRLSSPNRLLASATLLHKTNYGTVYIMPFDHMRCLAPDMTKVAPMPTIKPAAPETMPNGFRMPRNEKHE